MQKKALQRALLRSKVNRKKNNVLIKGKVEDMEKALKTFKEYLTSNSLKLTQPRLLIFKVFMSGESKMSPENLLENVQSIDDSVSRSTIYRTVKLLHNAGIARCIHSSDGATCYEPMGDQYTQMVCERCGKSFPIKNPYLECLLQETTRQQGFTLFRYQAVLYGVWDRKGVV